MTRKSEWVGREHHMRRIIVVLATMAAMVVYAGAALATSVSEAEPNDSIDEAQNLDPLLSLDADPNITNSTTDPHATVNGMGASREEDYDYYSFTVPQAGLYPIIGIFDIDGAWTGHPDDVSTDSFDSFLRLYNSNGDLIDFSDDGPPDAGSIEHHTNISPDSYLQHNFLNGGTYYLKVSEHTDTPPPFGYKLNVSVPDGTQDYNPPQLNLPADITVESSDPNGAQVSWQAPTATDENPANPQVTCSKNSGDTFPIYSFTRVECSATDAAGNTANGSFDVWVDYAFAGFFSPVDNPPVINKAKAGSAIPVKFSFGLNRGLNFLMPGSPNSQSINCETSDPVDNIEETVAAGSSSLSYDATTAQYTYVWKTNKAWANTCRKLDFTFLSGTPLGVSSHLANFQFVK
jgi:hypothetical protein